MAQRPRALSQVLPAQRGPGVLQDPADATMLSGELARSGRAVTEVSEGLARQAAFQQDQDNIVAASRAGNEMQLELGGMLADMQGQTTGLADNFTSDFVAAANERVEARLATIEDEGRRTVVARRLETVVAGLSENALSFQSRMRQFGLRDQTVAALEDLERAAGRNPEQWQDIEDEAGRTLDAANAYLPPDEIARLEDAFNERIRTAAVRQLMERDPRGVRDSLAGQKGAPYQEITAGLTDPQRNVLRRQVEPYMTDLEADERQRQRTIEVAAERERADKIAELRLAVLRGQADYADIEAVDRDVDLDPNVKVNLIRGVDKRREAQAEQAKRALRVEMSLQEVMLPDPRDKDFRKGVNEYFEQQFLPSQRAQNVADAGRTAGEGVPPWAASAFADRDTVAQLAQFVAQTGVLPDALAGQIEGAMAAGDDNQIAGAADLVARLKEAGGGYPIRQISEAARNMAFAVHVRRRAGMSRADAVRFARAALEPKDEQARQALRTQLRAGGDASILNEATRALAERADLDEEDVPPGMNADFRRMFEDYYPAVGGDREAAFERAWAELSWGKSEVDGSERWMRWPPEQVYGAGQDTDWMREQFLADVIPAVGLVGPGDIGERLRLEAGPWTWRSEQPKWAVHWLRKDFPEDPGTWVELTDENGLPLLWCPSLTDSSKWRTSLKRAQERLDKTRSQLRSIREGQLFLPGS